MKLSTAASLSLFLSSMTSVSNQKKSKSAFDSFQKKMSATPPNVPTRDKTKIPETATIKFIDRDAAGTGSTLSLSSECFNFVSLEESDAVDSSLGCSISSTLTVPEIAYFFGAFEFKN